MSPASPLLTYSEDVLRRIAVAVVSGALLAAGALPAAAAAVVGVHAFSIPGVFGIEAWGSYQPLGARTRITVCVEDRARGVYGGAAAAVAYGSGWRHQSVAAVTIGYGHASCQTMITSYTNHLIVDAVSGLRDGRVRQAGRTRQIY
jgi:hypothetical protein